MTALQTMAIERIGELREEAYSSLISLVGEKVTLASLNNVLVCLDRIERMVYALLKEVAHD